MHRARQPEPRRQPTNKSKSRSKSRSATPGSRRKARDIHAAKHDETGIVKRKGNTKCNVGASRGKVGAVEAERHRGRTPSRDRQPTGRPRSWTPSRDRSSSAGRTCGMSRVPRAGSTGPSQGRKKKKTKKKSSKDVVVLTEALKMLESENTKLRQALEGRTLAALEERAALESRVAIEEKRGPVLRHEHPEERRTQHHKYNRSGEYRRDYDFEERAAEELEERALSSRHSLSPDSSQGYAEWEPHPSPVSTYVSHNTSKSGSVSSVATIATPPCSSQGPPSRRTVQAPRDVFKTGLPQRVPLQSIAMCMNTMHEPVSKDRIPEIAVTAATPPMKRSLHADPDPFYAAVTRSYPASPTRSELSIMEYPSVTVAYADDALY